MEQLLNEIPVSPVLQKLIGVGAIILLTLLAIYLARFLLAVLGKRLAARTKTDLDDRLLTASRKPIYLLLFLIGLLSLSEYLQELLAEYISADWFRFIDAIFYAIGVVLVASIIVRVITTILQWYGRTVAVRTQTRIDDEFIPLLDRATKVIIYVLAALIILEHFDVDIKGMIPVLGVGSLAVALAAQETIANMIGGFVIMTDRPFRVGDWLSLEDGTTCQVYQIGVRSTKFKTLENTLIIMPNAELVKSTIHNITYPYPEIRLQVDVGVGYDSDMELVKKVILEEADAHHLVLKEPKPAFRFREFGDSSLNVTLFARTVSVLDRLRAESDLRNQILERFRKEGIEIPFPQRVVTMLEPGEEAESEKEN